VWRVLRRRDGDGVRDEPLFSLPSDSRRGQTASVWARTVSAVRVISDPSGSRGNGGRRDFAVVPPVPRCGACSAKSLWHLDGGVSPDTSVGSLRPPAAVTLKRHCRKRMKEMEL
jgi:hypothetical protein